MKKLLFVLAFTFIGEQAFSQMYIVTLSENTGGVHIACNSTYGGILSVVDPNGSITYTCIEHGYLTENSDVIAVINQQLNSIINQGYKLITTNNGASDNNGFINHNQINSGTTWYFAIP